MPFNKLFENKEQPHHSEKKTACVAFAKALPSVCQDTCETADAPTSTCVPSQVRKACAMSTIQTSN